MRQTVAVVIIATLACSSKAFAGDDLTSLQCSSDRAAGVSDGVTKQSFGAPLLVSGILGVAASGLSLVLWDSETRPGGTLAAVLLGSVLETVLGGALLGVGRTQVRDGLAIDCMDRIMPPVVLRKQPTPPNPPERARQPEPVSTPAEDTGRQPIRPKAPDSDG